MDILSELKTIKIQEDVIECLKREKLPLMMWGVGELAIEIQAYLGRKGIHITDVFVDEPYFHPGMMFNGYSVKTMKDLQEKYRCFNVILGHSSYEKAESLKEKQGVKGVFLLFSVNYNIFEKTPLEEIAANEEQFLQVYELFEDDESRENYLAFLKARVSGDSKYILNAFKKEMNFFNNDVFKITDKENYLDVGAYDGDTIKLFLKECKGKYHGIYALEPDDNNRRKLLEFINRENLDNIFVSKKGAWERNTVLYFAGDNEQISSVVAGEGLNEAQIEAAPLDELFLYKENISILKINYLIGVEEALKGAKNILKCHGPKLVITVGFNCENIRKIPRLIKNINPNYRLYLRYNRGMISSLTLYAII